MIRIGNIIHSKRVKQKNNASTMTITIILLMQIIMIMTIKLAATVIIKKQQH